MPLDGTSRNGYLGSPNVITSTANEELVPASPAGWTNSKYTFYEFDFYNTQACHVQINGGSAIYLAAGQNFHSTVWDKPINSFIVVDASITCNWMGKY